MDKWNPDLQAYEPTPEPPVRAQTPLADPTDRFSRGAALRAVESVRRAQAAGMYRDHQPGLPVGVQRYQEIPAAPQVAFGTGEYLARARANLAAEQAAPHPRPHAVAQYQETIAAIEEGGGFPPTEPRVRAMDRRAVAPFDTDGYAAYERDWSERHWTGQPDEDPDQPETVYSFTVMDAARAINRTSAKTVRRLEKDGILPPAERSALGIRVYSRAQLDALTAAAKASGIHDRSRPAQAMMEDFGRRVHAAWRALEQQ